MRVEVTQEDILNGEKPREGGSCVIERAVARALNVPYNRVKWGYTSGQAPGYHYLKVAKEDKPKVYYAIVQNDSKRKRTTEPFTFELIVTPA